MPKAKINITKRRFVPFAKVNTSPEDKSILGWLCITGNHISTIDTVEATKAMTRFHTKGSDKRKCSGKICD